MVVVLALVGLGYFALPSGDQMRPDLAVATPVDFAIGRSPDGAVRLLMSVTMVNVGDGPLIIDAAYDLSDQTWTVHQLIERGVRGTDSVEAAPAVGFGGDGHNHLHLLDAVTYTFDPDGERHRDEKAGYCFFDREPYRLDLPAAVTEPRFEARTCGDETSTRFSMGLSVGWGDEYAWHLPGQSIDITGVADGRYRVEFVADPDGLYLETDETNNLAYAVVELTDLAGDQPGVVVVESGSQVGDPP